MNTITHPKVVVEVPLSGNALLQMGKDFKLQLSYTEAYELYHQLKEMLLHDNAFEDEDNA